jgi:hypothetical protein
MRVLLISEGPHEGNPDDERPQALRCLAQQVLPAEATYEWLNVRDLPRGNPLPGKGGGHFKLGLKALWHATRQQFQAVVLVTDADGRHERLAQFEQAQASDRFVIPRAFGIAVEAFDAWIPADHQALAQAFQRNVGLQSSCESIRQPKEICRNLIREHGWAGGQSEFYETVCRCVNLQTIANRSPRGFAPFLERLQNLAATLRGSQGK